MTGTPDPNQSADLLLTATLFLMTQFVMQQREEIAVGVADHLRRLLAVREDLTPRLGQAITRLQGQWATIANIAARSIAEPQARCQVIPFPCRGKSGGR